MTQVGGAWLSDARAQRVLAVLEEGGFAAYFVGGCVRNALLGAPVADIDIATNARPERVMALAEGARLRVMATGIDHGTVTVICDGLACEVTTWRRDMETDGRRAVVSFTNDVLEDARRRDFTINALYCDRQGKVLDPLGQGLADLKARRVRFIEDAETRIREDYLRILRFFRFHAWYGDDLTGMDAEALAAISSLTAGLETLSRERVGHEMLTLLAAPNPGPALAGMATTGVLSHVLPGANTASMPVLIAFEANIDVPPDALRRLAALGRLESVQVRLRLSRAQTKRLKLLLDGVESSDNPEVLAWRHGAGLARDIVLLRAAMLVQPLPDDLNARLELGATRKFPITAGDLAPLKGAALGARLKQLEARWLASGFTLTKEELLA